MFDTTTDLVQFASKYILLTETRRGFRGKCPFHADLAESLLILPEKAIFKCFGCGKDSGAPEF